MRRRLGRAAIMRPRPRGGVRPSVNSFRSGSAARRAGPRLLLPDRAQAVRRRLNDGRDPVAVVSSTGGWIPLPETLCQSVEHSTLGRISAVLSVAEGRIQPRRTTGNTWRKRSAARRSTPQTTRNETSVQRIHACNGEACGTGRSVSRGIRSRGRGCRLDGRSDRASIRLLPQGHDRAAAFRDAGDTVPDGLLFNYA